MIFFFYDYSAYKKVMLQCQKMKNLCRKCQRKLAVTCAKLQDINEFFSSMSSLKSQIQRLLGDATIEGIPDSADLLLLWGEHRDFFESDGDRIFVSHIDNIYIFYAFLEIESYPSILRFFFFYIYICCKLKFSMQF